MLLLALVYAGTSTGLYAVGIWAPMIIHRFGFSYFELGLVNAIPNLFAVVTIVLWARNSDRTNERRLHVAIACLVAGIGMLLSGHAANAIVLIVGLSIANFGINAAKPPLWSMPTQFLSGSAAAAGIALINAMGSLIGGTIGPMVLGRLRDISGDYSLGLYFVSVTLFVSASFSGRLACAAGVAAVLNPRRSAIRPGPTSNGPMASKEPGQRVSGNVRGRIAPQIGYVERLSGFQRPCGHLPIDVCRSLLSAGR